MNGLLGRKWWNCSERPFRFGDVRLLGRARLPSILAALEQIDCRPQVVGIEVCITLRCLQVGVACKRLNDVCPCSLAQLLRDEDVPQVVKAPHVEPSTVAGSLERLVQSPFAPGLAFAREGHVRPRALPFGLGGFKEHPQGRHDGQHVVIAGLGCRLLPSSD